jgi:hypothetical protein
VIFDNSKSVIKNTSRIFNRRNPALRRVVRPALMTLQQAKKGCSVDVAEGIPDICCSPAMGEEHVPKFLQPHQRITLFWPVANPIFHPGALRHLFCSCSEIWCYFGWDTGQRDKKGSYSHTLAQNECTSPSTSPPAGSSLKYQFLPCNPTPN